ncbi:MAG: Ppx/GppA family phosphatase [Granulosicoccus sp.]|nr:Ppx/GppA family phosphatase [Granulosicoccus sp.]
MRTTASDIDKRYAAIDLGSNSFHMMIAMPEGNSIRKIDSLRMPVRLAAGLDDQKRLTPVTEQRALDAIAQYAERLREIPRAHIRMVGTNTLRRARNRESFMRETERLMGIPIEIISGREEARLIYSAVSHSFTNDVQQRLVIDIGGGSTELVIGKGFSPLVVESANMGCVSYAGRFLDGDENINSASIKRATLEAELEMQPLIVAYKEASWDEVIGCSGTIKAASRMLAELGLSDGAITYTGLKKLIKEIVKAGSVSAMQLSSVSDSRAQVVAGGLAVLRGIMQVLDIEVMQASQVALREGLIFDMLGKAEHFDIQSQTIMNLVNRFGIDQQQAMRVQTTARKLFEHVAEPWNLDNDPDLVLLDHAARLHELGMSVAHTQYHKHGAYILENSDLLGFTLAEQKALALLVRYHRRKIDHQSFEALPSYEGDRLLRLLGLLRLAALLHRARYDQSLDEIDVRVKEEQITVVAPQSWLDRHPLTAAELVAEDERLLPIKIRLKIQNR